MAQGGEPARRALEAIEEVRLEGVDSVAQQTRVSIEKIYASTQRFEEGMSMGMQRTYDELVYQMGIEAQRIRESGGLVSEGVFDAQRLRDHFQQSPQDILTPAVQEMLSQVMVQYRRQALERLEPGHRAQMDGLARENESLVASNNRLQGELTRLGGEVVGLQQLSAAQTPRLDLVPELQRRCYNLDGGSRGS